VTVLLPLLPLDKLFGFEPLPVTFLAPVGLIVLGYVIAAEVAKSVFYRHYF
jgi:Mg2+-importing ATPase